MCDRQILSSRFRIIVAITLMMAMTRSGFADDVSGPEADSVRLGLGAAVIVQAEPYRDLDKSTEVVGIPVLTVETRRFSWQGPRLAYHIYDKGPVSFDLIANWRFNGVDPDDSSFLAGMAQRKGTLDAGFNFAYSTERTISTVKITGDVLDRHGGFEVSASLGLPQRFGYLFVTPSIGIDYQSSDVVGYYYGVRPEEATINRPLHNGDEAVNFTLGLEAVQPLSKRWTLFGAIRQEWLDSSITDSPIVDADTRTSVFVGVVRSFGAADRPR